MVAIATIDPWGTSSRQSSVQGSLCTALCQRSKVFRTLLGNVGNLPAKFGWTSLWQLWKPFGNPKLQVVNKNQQLQGVTVMLF
jgi:hypothetical protein